MRRADFFADLAAQAGRLPVLLVEGEDDAAFCRHCLGVLDVDYASRLLVEKVGSRSQVLVGLRRFPAWFGLVDRDEWSEDRIREEQAKHGNLLVLPRFCMESYFVLRDELWEMLPHGQQERIDGGKERLGAALETSLPDWIAHGALWRVLLERRRGLGNLGFPSKLLDKPLTDRDAILDLLTAWHQQLDPEDILADYDRTLTDFAQMPREAVLRTAIHGKKYFRQVVALTLSALLKTPGKASESWLADLTAGITQVPSDLEPVLQRVLA